MVVPFSALVDVTYFVAFLVLIFGILGLVGLHGIKKEIRRQGFLTRSFIDQKQKESDKESDKEF